MSNNGVYVITMRKTEQTVPEGEFAIDNDKFGEIVRVNVNQIKDITKVPGIKKAYPTDPDPDQPEKHHAVISNMKDLNGDGNMHVFRGLLEKPYTRVACYDESGRRVWLSEKITPGGDDESGMPVVDIDGDGKYEIILSQCGDLYCLDAHTGAIKWMRELEKGGQRAGAGGWDCPMVVGHFTDKENLSIAVRSGLNMRCFDGKGKEIWPQPLSCETYGHCVARYDVNGDGLDEIFVAREKMVNVFKGDGNVLWEDQTQESHSDNFAFGDIDEDGKCEVVYDHDGCGGDAPFMSRMP